MKPKEVSNFQEWLRARGAEVLKPTNEYEVIRFKTSNGVSVVYRKNSGKLTFMNESGQAYSAYKNASSWRACPPTKRKSNGTIVTNTIRDRDGDDCFFCAKKVEIGEESVEHLVCLTHGGPNHISNLFLAHKECNKEAGYLSAPEKVKLYNKVRKGEI